MNSSPLQIRYNERFGVKLRALQNFSQFHFNVSLFSKMSLSQLPDTISLSPASSSASQPVCSSLHHHNVPSTKQNPVVDQACPPGPWLPGTTALVDEIFPLIAFISGHQLCLLGPPSFSTQLFVGRSVFSSLSGPCCPVVLVLTLGVHAVGSEQTFMLVTVFCPALVPVSGWRLQVSVSSSTMDCAIERDA